MHRLFVIFFSAYFFLCANINAQDTIPHRQGEILVMLKPFQHPDHLLKEVEENGVSFSPVSTSSNIWLLNFDTLLYNEEAILHKIRRSRLTIAAQYNHFIEQRGIPDDTQFPNQYALNNTGQGGGTPDADIDAVEAWDITTGGLTAQGDTIVVAVIDAGFQLTHPDLNFWKNFQEIAGNGTDDDGNGFVDDVNGWNVFTHTGNIVNNQHGTHVAGIIGARGNNNLGVSGVNWNVKLMPVVGATTVESEAIEAYAYVLSCRRLYDATNGAKGAFVVATNSSFGVNHGQPVNFPIWCAYYDSLGAAGILSAAATANANWNIDVEYDIPCSCPSPYLITVSSTDRNDSKVISSAYGVQSIDIAAPGASVYSTYPTSTYNTMTGTSMASPHVAGATSLMYAAACDSVISMYKLYPDSIARVMKNILINAVDPKIGFDTLYASGGRLNLYNSLLGVQAYGNCMVTAMDEIGITDDFEVSPNPASKTVVMRSSNKILSVKIMDATGRQLLNEETYSEVVELALHELGAGIYYISVKKETGEVFTKKLVKS